MALLIVAAACAPKRPDRPFDAGLAAVQEAVLAAPPGAKEAPFVPGRCSQGFPGSGASGGDGTVTGSMVRTARFDWSSLVADAKLGVAAVMLAHADAEADVLRRHGFEAFDGHASVSSTSGAPDVAFVAVSGSAPGTGHSSSWSAPRDVERLVYRRLYRAPGTGGFVISRIEYDGRTRVAEAELTYVEETVSAAYPAYRTVFNETVAAAGKRR